MTRIGFVKRAILVRSRSKAATATLILAAVLVPTLLRLGIDPLVGGKLPYLTYFPAIMLAAVFLGWRAASIAAVGSAIVAQLLFSDGRVDSWTDGEMLAGTLLFGAAAALLIALGQTLRRAVIELDATARREAFLASELGHRAKNHLALIEALARQCQQSGQTPDAFFAKLLPRIQALACAQDLLTRSGFSACSLRSLVENALKPFEQHGGISLQGPETLVSPEECTPLIMAIHELATNASKYGALSVPGGRVQLGWTGADADGSGVTIAWQESGGPPVAPPTRRGLGSRLIARHPAFGKVALEFPADGVRCRIELKPADRSGTAK